MNDKHSPAASDLIGNLTPIDEARLSQIAADIQGGNAILFLGPGASLNYKDHDCQKNRFSALAQAHPKQILDFHEQDSLLIFHPGGRNYMGMHLAAFFAEDFRNELLETLSEIPFHLIISLTPDHAMANIFEEKGFDHEFQRNDRKPARKGGDFSGMHPLIYNMLGSLKSPSSLVVSHSDLFDLVESIHIRESLPEYILDELNPPKPHSKTLIFIGLEYDKWYFHFLLSLLKMNERTNPVVSSTSAPPVHQHALYKADFNAVFIDQQPLEFAQALLSKTPPEQRRQARPDWHAMTEFLLNAFDANDFDLFCTTHFPLVTNEFTNGQMKSQRIQLLLDHVNASNSRQRLLVLARAANPAQYTLHFPSHGS